MLESLPGVLPGFSLDLTIINGWSAELETSNVNCVPLMILIVWKDELVDASAVNELPNESTPVNLYTVPSKLISKLTGSVEPPIKLTVAVAVDSVNVKVFEFEVGGLFVKML